MPAPRLSDGINFSLRNETSFGLAFYRLELESIRGQKYDYDFACFFITMIVMWDNSKNIHLLVKL